MTTQKQTKKTLDQRMAELEVKKIEAGLDYTGAKLRLESVEAEIAKLSLVRTRQGNLKRKFRSLMEQSDYEISHSDCSTHFKQLQRAENDPMYKRLNFVNLLAKTYEQDKAVYALFEKMENRTMTEKEYHALEIGTFDPIAKLLKIAIRYDTCPQWLKPAYRIATIGRGHCIDNEGYPVRIRGM